MVTRTRHNRTLYYIAYLVFYEIILIIGADTHCVFVTVT